MSDERTPPPGGGDDEELPNDDRGFGLTEEFARLEQEIQGEGGDGAEESPDAEHDTGEWLPESEEGEEAPPPEEPVRTDEPVQEEQPPAADEDAENEQAEESQAEESPEAEEPDAEASESDDSEADAPDPAEEATVVATAGAGAAAPRPGLFSTPSTDPVVRPQPTGARPAVGPQQTEYFDDVPESKVPSLWWRFMAGSVVIITAVATAVALSSLLLLTDVAAKLQPIAGIQDKIEAVDPGGPQTILILGSDERSDTPGDPGRSDTAMLLRVDPDRDVLSLFSLPRDLKVEIPGYGTGKLNDAYSYGGVEKALETVKQLTGLEINHVVNVDFQGFADAVDAIGCVYVDVDRDYFNDNSSGFDPYAAIDVNAGYQRLCGNNALQYVRYRHTDTDIVRAARQQDFLREARQQVPPKEVLPIIGGDTGSKLIDIFTKYTQSDIDNPAQMIGALRSFVGVIDVPVQQIRFQGSLGPSYVTATQDQIDDAIKQFLGEDQEDQGSGDSGGGGGGGSDKKKDGGGGDGDSGDGLSDANVIPTDDSFARFGRTSARRLKFPVFIPTVVAPDSSYDAGSRQYDIKDLDDDKQPAYKMVIEYSPSDIIPQYYGVEGTTWSDPPILADPSETRTIDGEDYDLYFDGDRLRLVAWHDSEGNSYWVQNTLERLLDEDQMLAIATSMDEAHG